MFFIILVVIGCKTDPKKQVSEEHRVETKHKKDVELNVETKYVIARSGLNYRKDPQKAIMGKFEYGKKLEIIEHTAAFETIVDDGKSIEGEWLGVRFSKDTVYVFSGFLSDTLSEVTYEWVDELCSYLGRYDTKRYTKTEIDNCYKIIYGQYFYLSNSPSVYKISDIEDLNKNDLTTEYLKKMNDIQKLKLPKESKWQEHKQNIIVYLNESYKMYSICYDAYSTLDFKVLDGFWKTDDLLKAYSNALQGTDDELLETWERFTSKQAEKNGSPEKVWEDYRYMKNSQNWREHAKVQIMTFGWWNAANKYINTYEGYKYVEDFSKLFSSMKEMGCDEP